MALLPPDPGTGDQSPGGDPVAGDPSICIVIDYFADAWPPWTPLFLESCRHNPDIEWLVHANCAVHFPVPRNVSIVKMEFGDYCEHVSHALDIRFLPDLPYKICDIRPMLGRIWQTELSHADFYGYGDLDVIYGCLRETYDAETLIHDVISAHDWCISGHLALFRNRHDVRELYLRIADWERLVTDPQPARVDEDHFLPAIREGDNPNPANGVRTRTEYRHWHSEEGNGGIRVLLKEMFTTPLTPSPWTDGENRHPGAWYWRNGHLTNDVDGARSFPYLHFMNYVNGTYLDPKYGEAAPWRSLPCFVHLDPGEMRERGMQIDLRGFTPLTGP